MRTASWVIRKKGSIAGLYETFNKELADKINKEKYEAIPILQYLQELNSALRRGAQL